MWKVYLFLSGAFAIASAGALPEPGGCSRSVCDDALKYDELVKLFKDGNISTLTEEIEGQLAGQTVSDEEWISIIRLFSNGQQPDKLQRYPLTLEFLQNQTSNYNSFSGMTISGRNKIYGHLEQKGRTKHYSAMHFNLIKMKNSTAVPEIDIAYGLYVSVRFTSNEESFKWEGVGKNLALTKLPNGEFIKIGNLLHGLKGEAMKVTKNAMVIRIEAFTAGNYSIPVNVLTNSKYELGLRKGDHASITGFLENTVSIGHANTTFHFDGSLPNKGSGSFHSSLKGNMASRNPSGGLKQIEVDGQSEGYTSFDGSDPFSDGNLINIFNSQFLGAANY